MPNSNPTIEHRKKSGRHPEKALTAAQVKTASRPGKYRDGNGLFLRVEKSGSKRWVQRINIRGKPTELGLGSASLVPLAEAREIALENRKIARGGGDPLRSRSEASATFSFEEASREVHKIHRPSWRNKKHAAQFISTLEKYAFPRLGRISVADVTTADVLGVLQPIWLKKPETARRVRQRIGTVMRWAIANGWRQYNPAEAIAQALPKQDKTQQHRKALPYSEVAEFLDAVNASNAGALTDIPHIPSKFVEIVPLSHRQGNCIPYAAIRWHDFGNRPALGRPLGHFSRHPDTPLLSLSPRRRFPRPTPERVFVADH